MTTHTPPPDHWPQWAREDYAERAAIMEWLGRMPRADAERRARELVQAKIDKQQAKGEQK